MLDLIVSLLRRLSDGPKTPPASKRENGVDRYIPAYQHAMFIRRVIDSNKTEEQIETSIGWIYRLYRRRFLTLEIFHELNNHADYRRDEIMAESIKKDFICPHVKKRADEIIEEERRKNIRIIKTEVK